MSSTTTAVIRFQTVSVQQSITRPANATIYSDGDCLSAADDSHYTFEKAVQPEAQSGSISTVRCISSANQAQKPDLELWLFHKDIADVADNAAFAPTDAEMLTLVGVVDLPEANWRTANAGAAAAGNAVCEATNVGLAFRASTPTLYGQLVVRNPGTLYTPVSGEIFTVDLVVTAD